MVIVFFHTTMLGAALIHRASTFMILVIQAYDFRHVLESTMGLSPTVDKGIWLEKRGVALVNDYSITFTEPLRVVSLACPFSVLVQDATQ